MEGGSAGIFLHSDSEPLGGAAVGAGQKIKRGKFARAESVSLGAGGAQKNMLADITNLQQQQQQKGCVILLNQKEKKQSAPLAESDISTEQLLTDIAMLKKLLANRNMIIEKCKAEVQKSQINFQKLRKQNSELALTNSQMLAELNASRQKLKELQHELGSKNGILKAMKLELTAKENAEKLMHESNANEVGASQSKQSDQSFQEENKEGNPCNAKRRRVSKSQSFASAVVKQVKSAEKVANQRYSLRSEFVGLKAEKPGLMEDNFEVDEIKYNGLHLQENLAIENEPTSLGSKVHEESREDNPSSGPSKMEQIIVKKNIEKKSVRRQSARFKPEHPEPAADLFEIDDAKFGVSRICDNVSEKSGSITSSTTSGQENKENYAFTFDPRENKRSSVGRPIRRAVEKVVSYKEVPLKVKMRRPN